MARDDDESVTRICIDCSVRSPEANTTFTLISQRYGWRLTRRVETGGALVVEWRCPTCFARYKKAKSAELTPAEGIPFVRERDKK